MNKIRAVRTTLTKMDLMGDLTLEVFSAPRRLDVWSLVASLLFTCHSERSPQAGGQLLGVVVPQLHATHSHDLADEADLLSFQVFTPQILKVNDKGEGA